MKDVLLHAKIDKIIGEDHICDNITKAVELANGLAKNKEEMQEINW